jgi:cell division protease FtsH
MLFLAVSLGVLAYINWSQAPSKISLSYLENLIAGKDFEGNELKYPDGRPIGPNIDRLTIVGEQAYGIFKEIPPAEPTYDADGQRIPATKPLKKQFSVQIPNPNSPAGAELYQRLRANNIAVVKEPEPAYDLTSILLLALIFSLPILLMFYLLRRMQNQIGGGGSFLSSFSRSPARRFEPSDKRVTFGDVAGLDNVKGDLQEIVEYLKDPEKFQRLGGQIPKGVLLFGPPGTGKTLMARAVAGEAGVPFFSVNGAEFIQMFVGVGASRVRDLFASAKRQAPAIVFIDEIDAVGRQRGAGLGGGHDEREQTLNQILGEMDGFQKNESLIVLAATNRPDVLDPALLRPGRFDRHIMVSRPTQAGRLAIFKVHVRDVPLGPDVDMNVLASASAGMTGADIENLVNEAALWAARNNKTVVEMADFYYAQDKVLMGARREEILSEKEKRRTAYHESGHTMAAWYLPGAMPVHKVTVIPRGHTLGVTQMTPLEDRLNISENELRDQLVVALAGRAAEQLVYDELTVGAENDLEQATQIARRMVTHWGMSGRLGPVSFKMSDEDPFLGREIHKNRQFSEHTMELIDDEVSGILQTAAKAAYRMLADRRELLDQLAERLVKTEELGQPELESILGPSVHKSGGNGQPEELDLSPG